MNDITSSTPRHSAARRVVGSALSRLTGSRHRTATPDATADELAAVLSLSMQATQTAAALAKVASEVPARSTLVEVAAGKPYELSSALDAGPTSGTVAASGDHFFHTGFGPGQSIRIDLGRPRRVHRIEISNRRDGHQDRAKHIFAVLSGPQRPDRVFPMFKHGALPDRSWREHGIDVPGVRARYVTITSPVATALHFADIRVFAAKETTKPAAPARPAGVQAPNSNGIDVLEACATHRIPVRGLIHVGANGGGEYPYYAANTTGPLLYVEAIPDLVETVRARLDPARPHFIHQAAVAESSGETVTFHVASNNGQSSSLLELGRHATIYPKITYTDAIEVVTETLDDIVAARPEADAYNVVVLDVQGAELRVLHGARQVLKQVDAVVAEVSPEPLYEGGCTFLEVTNLLAEEGFVFRDAKMRPQGWGDALYTRGR